MPRLPGRQPKAKAGEDAKLTIASVDGILRQLREKEILIQTPRKEVLRFRLLAKTQFKNKAGEPVRDSLIHAGDQLQIQVNPDDEETALRVILLRSGSASERTAAEKPVEEAAMRNPRSEDFSKPRTITTKDKAGPEPEPELAAEPEVSERTPSRAATAEAPVAPAVPALGPRDPKLSPDEQIIQDARTTSAMYTGNLPKYGAQQMTTRYFQSGGEGWQKLDAITAELAYSNGKEEYSNFQIDGRDINRPEDRTRSWTTSDFSTTPEDLFLPAAGAKFKRRGEAHFAGRDTVIFNYTVDQANSHWTLVAPDQRRYSPAYEGAVWVDKETRQVLRIEQRSVSMPADFSFSKAESNLSYRYVRLGQKTYLLPAAAENVGCMNGSGACSRNVIEFRNYHP